MRTGAKRQGDEYYQCPLCKFYYLEKEWADACEAWCRDHSSCNLDITKHAVHPPFGKEP
ncbi:hypothetical protein HY624_00525 [Candidatus Uhrbacteria bacterium]|nr:hypothetical protein [Candidatus Uhrbacteria bacterium]